MAQLLRSTVAVMEAALGFSQPIRSQIQSTEGVFGYQVMVLPFGGATQATVIDPFARFRGTA